MSTTLYLGDAKVKEKQKNKKKFYCEVCDHTASQKIHLQKHLETNKHKKKMEKTKAQIEANCKKVTQKWKQKWKCNSCSKQYNSRNGLWKHNKKYKGECFNRHLIKKKASPKKNRVTPKKSACKVYSCEYCEKEYKTITGLNNHKNKCNQNNSDNNESKSDAILKEILPFVQNVGEAIKNGKIGSNNTNNISINVFLNEHCKNALNLTDFVDTMKVTLEDIVKTHSLGMEGGISMVVLKNLNDIPIVERPIHCADQKRGKFYIKDNDKWEKGNGEKMDNMISNVKIKHVKTLKEWEDDHPNYMNLNHKDNKAWQEMINTFTTPTDDKNKKEIKKQIAKEVPIKEAIDSIK